MTRVVWILDLQPRRDAPVGVIRTARPLRHNPLDVTLRRHPEQIAAALCQVVEIQQPAADLWHDRLQVALPLQQRQAAQVYAVDAQDVEGVEPRPRPTEHHRMEVGPPVGLETADLAVEYCAVSLHGVRNFLRELRPRFELMPVPRDELAPMAGHVRERAEAV